METKQCFSIFLIVLWMSVLAIIPVSAAAPVDGDQLCVSGAGTTGANGTYTYNGGAAEFQKGTYIIFYVLPLTDPPHYSEWWLSNLPTDLYYTDSHEVNDMTTPGFVVASWRGISGMPPPFPIVQNGSCPPVPD